MNRKHFDLLKDISFLNVWKLKNPSVILDLHYADLRVANLQYADLRGADFRVADLRVADLRKANLQGADLRGADLKGADLRNANLRVADLRSADLQGADIKGADLRSADLRSADLQGADLKGADLRGVRFPSPTMVLSANWGECSPNTTLELMRLDASSCPEGNRIFEEWFHGDGCPYNKVRVQRVALFQQKRELWEPGEAPSNYEAMCMVLDEHCPNWEDEINP